MSGSKGGMAVLVAASLLAAVLGSVHAFSVFLEPLEQQFGASRASVSAIYSVALICLTAVVLIGHRIFARAPAAMILLASALLAAAGAVVAGLAQNLAMVWVGYGVIFGAANGLGYGFGLQIAAQANAGREGMAMGIVTAAYALGAVLSPAGFARAVELGGFAVAMIGLAAVLCAVGAIAAALMASSGMRFRAAQAGAGDAGLSGLAPNWLAYFGGVMAGLMVIGHAAGIAASVDPGRAAWVAPVVIAICNLAGSIAGGRAADLFAPRLVLVLLPGLTVAALLCLAWSGGYVLMLICLGVAGYAYGGTIAAYPAVIAKRFGPDQSAKAYGRVFTAWGAAGLAGPWMAGLIFDATGGYGGALLVAAGIGAMSVVTAWTVFDDRRQVG